MIELLLNGDFSEWAEGIPNNWDSLNPLDFLAQHDPLGIEVYPWLGPPNPEWTGMWQDVLEVGKTYTYSIEIEILGSYDGGGIILTNGNGINYTEIMTTPGIFTGEFIAQSETRFSVEYRALVDWAVINSVSVQEKESEIEPEIGGVLVGTKLSDIIGITISRETARLTLVGFGTPLLLGETYRVYDRVKAYTEPDDMLDDGYEDTDPLYLMAQSLMAQDRSPDQFKVGRKYADVNAKQTVTFTGSISAGHFHLILGAETTGTIAYNADASTIKSAIEALTAVTEVTVTGSIGTAVVIEFTGADATTHWDTFDVDIDDLTGATDYDVTVNQYGSAVETYTTAISQCRIEDDDWYCLLTETRTKADILLIAAAIEVLSKIYIACSDDADVITSADDDVMSELQDMSYDRTSLIWSTDEANYPDCAWVGLQIAKEPGSTTWKFKNLAGITADYFTTTEVNYLKDKNANSYEEIAGVSVITGEGCMASGEYIDVIQGSDWLQQRMAERIFTRLINSEKIPFTTQGMAVIENEIRYQLGKGVDSGFLAEGSMVVTTPAIEDVDPLEKSARWLNGVTFSATLAGAVHKVTIVGKLEV